MQHKPTASIQYRYNIDNCVPGTRIYEDLAPEHRVNPLDTDIGRAFLLRQ